MYNYTGVIANLLLYRNPATDEELAKFKPELARLVITCSGKRVYVRTKFDHHKYWFYNCTVCGKTGITRTGRINDFWCECQKNAKRPRKTRRKKIQPEKKMCLMCKQTLPLTTDYFYKTKTGYFGSYCISCHKSRYVPDRQFGQLI